MCVLRLHCLQNIVCRVLQYAAAHGYVAMSSCASTSSGMHTVWQHCRLSARRAASWCLHCSHTAPPQRQAMQDQLYGHHPPHHVSAPSCLSASLPLAGAPTHTSSQSPWYGTQNATHQDVVLTDDLVQEGVAGAEVGGKDRVLISRATALHLQAVHPGIILQANAC